MLPSPSSVHPPPPLCVDDDAPIRHDIDNPTVREVFPDLPRGFCNAHKRQRTLETNDERAYDTIRETFPDFHPPSGERRKRGRA